ncbi:MAG TPA: hypothetical protein VGB85_18195, partial [Nannocystis sp.]
MRAPVVLGALALILLHAFPYAERTRNANERPRLLQGMALVEEGTLAIDGLIVRGIERGPDIARSPATGRVYPNKPPGTSLVAAVAYATAREVARASAEPLTLRGYTWWARLFGGVLPTLVLAAALGRRFGPVLGARPVWLAIGLLVLATPMAAYAHLLYGHALTACLLWVGAVVVVDACRDDRPGYAAWGGALAGAAVGVEYSAAFAGVPLAVFVLVWARRHWRASLGATLGAAGSLALLAWYHAAAYGSPLRTGYHHVTDPGFAAKHGEGLLGLVAPSWTALHAHVLSHASGLLWWAPLVLLALAGLWDMSRGPADSAVRSHARVHLAMFLALLLACISLNFEGGWRVGPRYLVAVLPALVLGWAGAVRWVHAGRAGGWVAFVALLTWSTVLNGLAASLWPHFDLGNIHQPVSEVLLPLWKAGRAPYVAGGIGVTAVIAASVLGLLGLLGSRGRIAATVVGVGLGVGLVAATKLIPPHPRARAN